MSVTRLRDDLSPIAITVGEPAGIGPDLCVRLIEREWSARLVLVGNRDMLQARAHRLGVTTQFVPYASGGRPIPRLPAHADTLEVVDCPLQAPAVPGHLDAANARAVLATLDRAVAGCVSGEFAAMVTAPVQKSVINAAGITFSGHTEYLAERTGAPDVVMMLAGDTAFGPLRVALMTTHLALASVPKTITRELVARRLRIIAADLRARFRIAAPRIAICGLNPHAGEDGYLGREEIDVIKPALAGLRASGIDITGPLPADTLFVPSHLQHYDCVVAMYHDQGLPVLKHATFGHGVNVTLGLPIVRTSVDHGTALDLAIDAGKARTADPGSLFAAVDLAIALARG